MDSALSSKVNSIRLTLQAVEAQVASSPMQSDGLEELKSAVDEIRLRIWAIMAASAEGSDGLALQRFRLRRAISFCDSLAKDFEEGAMSGRHRECALLLASLARLTTAVAQCAPNAH